ncbi:MAG: hypothetical protein QOJ15_6377 [Bradyrhizobium sp.]|jgi:hypothetical protein|nr:hypothetical protein [Bradyrhizobium sp.]
MRARIEEVETCSLPVFIPTARDDANITVWSDSALAMQWHRGQSIPSVLNDKLYFFSFLFFILLVEYELVE